MVIEPCTSCLGSIHTIDTSHPDVHLSSGTLKDLKLVTSDAAALDAITDFQEMTEQPS